MVRGCGVAAILVLRQFSSPLLQNNEVQHKWQEKPEGTRQPLQRGHLAMCTLISPFRAAESGLVFADRSVFLFAVRFVGFDVMHVHRVNHFTKNSELKKVLPQQLNTVLWTEHCKRLLLFQRLRCTPPDFGLSHVLSVLIFCIFVRFHFNPFHQQQW